MMNVYRWNEMSGDEKRALLKRCEQDIKELEENIRAVVDAVQAEGDRAIARFTKEFDGADLKPSEFRARKKDFEAAEKKVSSKIKKAIEKAVENVRKYHEKQMPEPFWLTPVEEGVYAGEKISAVPVCGLYVPRGKGSFPTFTRSPSSSAAGLSTRWRCRSPIPICRSA